MVLDIGELVGRLRVDDRGMEEGLDRGESRFKKFGDKLTGLAVGLGAAAGVALFGGLLASMEQSNIGAKISAQLGGTTEDAKVYGKIAGKLYAENWGDSVATIGETLREVARAHIADGTDADLEDLTRRAQILSDVFDADVKGSVEAVQQLIRNGLVPDARGGFDLIAAAMQGGVDKAEDLNDTLIEYSTKFRDMGLSGAQALGLMSQGLKAGARDADTVADAIKEFQIRATDGSTSSADAFKTLGLDAKKMTSQFAAGGQGAANGLQLVLTKLKEIKDPAERNAAAVGLFGTKAEDLGQALYALDLPTATSEFEGAAGAIDKAGKTLGETDSAKLEGFKRKLEGLATTLAADLVPSLESAGSWIQKNQAWIEPLAATLGTLAVAIVAVNLATKAWAAATAAFTAVQWLFNASLWASPITWIVIAVVALIAVIVLIATKTDWFQRLWGWAWGGIKAAAMAVWDWIKGTLWPGIQTVMSAIGAAAMWLWHNVMEPVWNGIVKVFQVAWRIISSFANLMKFAFFVLIAYPAMQMWTNYIQPAFNAIGAAAMWLWQNAILPAWNGIMAGMQAVGAAAMWLWKNAIQPAWNAIAGAAVWLWKTVLQPTWNAITSAVTTVGEVIRKVFEKVGGWISGAFSGAAGIVKSAMNGVIGIINGAISGINHVIDTANKVPGVNFPKIGSIPRLATGGVVSPSPGGTPVIMGDGGQVEYGVPEDRLLGMLARAQGMGGPGGGTLRVVVATDKDAVLKVIRTEVRAKGGGRSDSVQRVLA